MLSLFQKFARWHVRELAVTLFFLILGNVLPVANAQMITQESIEQARESAEMGDMRAQFILGYAYEQGIGVIEDKAEGIKWLRIAAEQGYALAQYQLGLRYANSDNELIGREEAKKWLLRSAEQGYTEAQYNLGVIYASGDGPLADSAEAIKWFKAAADQGHGKAQYNLGVMYLRSEMRQEKLIEIYILFDLAEAQGIQEATIGKSLVAKEMAVDQQASAPRQSGEPKRRASPQF